MSHRTCAFEGCEYRLSKAPGPGRWPKWCPTHRGGIDWSPTARDARRAARADALIDGRWPAVEECKRCGRGLPEKRVTGPRSSYCSSKCKSAASYARRREAISERRRATNREILSNTLKTCPQCHAEFRPEKSLKQKYCSPKCAQDFSRDSLSRECSAPDCDRPVRAKSLCNMHYRRKMRAEGAEWDSDDQPWSDRRRANWKKRYALGRGAADAESFSYGEIFDRDNWTCGICSDPVDRLLEWPDPMSASLDHIVPVSQGGAHVRDNAQCAHLGCNVSKGARISI